MKGLCGSAEDLERVTTRSLALKMAAPIRVQWRQVASLHAARALSTQQQSGTVTETQTVALLTALATAGTARQRLTGVLVTCCMCNAVFADQPPEIGQSR